MAQVMLCTTCEQPVRELQPADKIYGKVQSRFGSKLYIHQADSFKGVPSCGRQYLEEVEVFTEGHDDN